MSDNEVSAALPLSVVQCVPGSNMYSVRGQDGAPVGIGPFKDDAAARFVATACNSHAALVEALEAVRYWIEGPQWDSAESAKDLAMVDAALAKARGE